MLDSHTHVVSPDRKRYPLADPDPPSTAWHVQTPISVEDLLTEMNAAGVAGGVLVQAMGCYGTDNRYVLDGARLHSRRLVAVGAVDAFGQNAVETLRTFVAEGGRGIRLGLANEASEVLRDHRIPDVVHTAGELGVPVVMAVGPHQLEGIAALAGGASRTQLLVDHCGFVPLSGGPPWSDAAALLDLSRFANVAVKLSSMNLLDAGADAAAFAKRLVRAFGSERVLWGSDYPHTDEWGYEGLVALARGATSLLTPAEAGRILGGNTAQIWGLSEP